MWWEWFYAKNVHTVKQGLFGNGRYFYDNKLNIVSEVIEVLTQLIIVHEILLGTRLLAYIVQNWYS